MPRGVYDRSKLKTATKTPKTEAAPAAHKPKGKPGRKPGSVSTKGTASTAAVTSTKVSGNEIELFSTVRANLETLNAVAARFPDLASLKTEIAEHVEVISTLRKKVFGTKETQQAPVETKTAKAEVASNGATTAYPASVPMPPAPIPTIPTQS